MVERNINLNPWIDKYRPTKLDDIVSHDDIKMMLSYSVNKGDLPHLLFHGNSGTGKTSMINVIVTQLYGDKLDSNVLELNASDENGINVIRNKIIKFASIVVSKSTEKINTPSFKTIILDEADAMTSEAQTALKKVMEEMCEITRFVLICNYDNKIIDAIKSRCAIFRFSPISNELMCNFLKKICINEKINISVDVLKTIVNISKGDARKAVNILQNTKYIKKKEILNKDVYDITSFVEPSFINKYWKHILNTNIETINNVSMEIINTGYPMDNILNCIKNKVIKMKLSDKNISNIIIYIGKIERMINCCSDNYIQLLGLLTFIHCLNKGYEVDIPEIF